MIFSLINVGSGQTEVSRQEVFIMSRDMPNNIYLMQAQSTATKGGISICTKF